MKNLILIFVCLLPLMPCQAAESRSAQENQNRQQLEIEKYISRLRGQIEYYYANQLIELSQRAQAQIRLLEIADKPVYASLAEQAEVAKTVLHIDDYGYRAPWYLEAKTERILQLADGFDESKSYSDFVDIIKRSPKWFTMARSYSVADTTRTTDGNDTTGSISGSTAFLGWSWIDYGDFADIIKESPKRFAAAHGRIAERKNRILAHLEFETLKLQRQRQYALTVGLAQLEKRLREDALKPQPQAAHGLITGILYSQDRPAAIINRTIVHSGDTIYGVTVVKIRKDKVVFEKNGKKWEQQVQQKPQAYWK